MGLGFETARLKTGTPARVDGRTVDFSGLQAQPGDPDVRWFSFDPEVRAALFWTFPLLVLRRKRAVWHAAAAGRGNCAPAPSAILHATARPNMPVLVEMLLNLFK